MRIVCIAGSNHQEATSTKLVCYLAASVRERGHEAHVIDLYKWPLPLYCPDDEEVHPNVVHVRESIFAATAIILATPEYHGSVSGVLKNALDYMSLEHFYNKVVLSVSSAGGAVGASSLMHLQAIVRNVHGINCPEWISIGGAARQFGPDRCPGHDQVVQRAQRTLDCFLKLAEHTSALCNNR